MLTEYDSMYYDTYMFTSFIEKKLRNARYKLLDDGSYFGSIPGVKGVWANAKTLSGCQDELREVLEEWLILKIRDRETVPGFSFRINQKSVFAGA